MKTIYNTYVEMESQEQCDRMKQLCIDNGLRIWDVKMAFDIELHSRIFRHSTGNEFIGDFAVYNSIDELTKITEQEFIELLKNQ